MRVLYHQKNPRLETKAENEDLQLVKSTKNSSPKVIKIFRNEPGTLQAYNADMSPGFGPVTFDEVSPSPSPLLGVKNHYERDSGPASSNAIA